jgi:hypothetical protein
VAPEVWDPTADRDAAGATACTIKTADFTMI